MASAVKPSAAEKLMTAEEFLLHPHSAHAELIKGMIVTVSPTNYQHGRVALKIGRLLANFVAEHDLGDVLGAEAGFILRTDPDTVRAPDIAYVSKARRPSEQTVFARVAPDLAVEVASPNDRPDDIQEKIEDYLAAGTRLAWVVYPKTGSITVYRSLRDVKVLRGDDMLTGEDVLPGFECRASAIFE